MRHFVVAAHPSVRSFNHAVVEAYTSELIERGHRVECRDLYAAGFNPILSARDLAAVARGKMAKDIKVEQAAIRRADVLTFISPLWWSGFPAMLKGYLDRVFCAGFAYVIKGEDYLPGLLRFLYAGPGDELRRSTCGEPDAFARRREDRH